MIPHGLRRLSQVTQRTLSENIANSSRTVRGTSRIPSNLSLLLTQESSTRIGVLFTARREYASKTMNASINENFDDSLIQKREALQKKKEIFTEQDRTQLEMLNNECAELDKKNELLSLQKKIKTTGKELSSLKLQISEVKFEIEMLYKMFSVQQRRLTSKNSIDEFVKTNLDSYDISVHARELQLKFNQAQTHFQEALGKKSQQLEEYEKLESLLGGEFEAFCQLEAVYSQPSFRFNFEQKNPIIDSDRLLIEAKEYASHTYYGIKQSRFLPYITTIVNEKQFQTNSLEFIKNYTENVRRPWSSSAKFTDRAHDFLCEYFKNALKNVDNQSFKIFELQNPPMEGLQNLTSQRPICEILSRRFESLADYFRRLSR